MQGNALSLVKGIPAGVAVHKAAPATVTLGVGGSVVHGGYLSEEWETNQKLQGLTKWKTYAEMLVNTDIVGAGVRYFLNLVAFPKWTAKPAVEGDTVAKELAEFVEEVMGDMDTPWARVVRRAAMYRFYGYTWQEWTAKKREDGRIGFLDVEPRPHKTIERWDQDEHGKVIGVWQRDPKKGVELYLPKPKSIYMVDDSLSDSPEGLGLFRHIAGSANRLDTYLKLEGIGFETDLRGIPLARAPLALLDAQVKAGEITETQATQYKAALQTFIENHYKSPESGLILDSYTYTTEDEKGTPSGQKQWDLELLKGGQTSLPDLANAITRLNHSIARLLGVEHLLLGSDSKGSHALAQQKTHQFYLIVNSTLKEIVQTYDKDWLDPLWSLNGLPPDLKPKLEVEEVQFRDVEQVTGALRDLAQAGAPLIAEDPAVNEVRTMVGLPKVDDMAGATDAAIGGGTGEPEPPTEPEVPEDEEE